jgi:hypothetical protein
LRSYDNLTSAELGATLDMSEEAARKLYLRALRDMADLMRHFGLDKP